MLNSLSHVTYSHHRFKSKTNTTKKGQLKSFKMYNHSKFLSQSIYNTSSFHNLSHISHYHYHILTITHIIDIPTYIHRHLTLFPKDLCIELDSKVCTNYHSYQFLFQISYIVFICTKLIHMSYSDQLIYQTSNMAI